MAGLGLAPWQWGVISLVYVACFLVPAVWMARRCRRDGERPFVWVALVLVTSVIGVIEYSKHRSILKKRAKRGEQP